MIDIGHENEKIATENDVSTFTASSLPDLIY
jgi:hypothetical protein